MPESNTDPLTEHKRRELTRLGLMSPKLDKLLRQVSRAQARQDSILLAPAEDSLWRDQEFWDERWPAMVDSLCELREKAQAEESRQVANMTGH